MIFMFQGASIFNQDISDWNVTKVVASGNFTDFDTDATAWVTGNKPTFP
jgi:hypothetical protein